MAFSSRCPPRPVSGHGPNLNVQLSLPTPPGVVIKRLWSFCCKEQKEKKIKKSTKKKRKKKHKQEEEKSNKKRKEKKTHTDLKKKKKRDINWHQLTFLYFFAEFSFL